MTVTGNDDSIKCDTVSELKAELVKLLGPKDVGDTSAFNAYLPKKGVSQTFTIHWCRKWVQSTADEIQEVTLEEVASSTSPLPEGTTAAPAAG